MPESFYFDTYALVEITRGNQTFIDYTTKEFVINDLTLAEFYHVLLRDYNEQTADYWFKKISPNSKPVPKELLIEAVKFRRVNRQKNKNFSFFDAAGYIYAVKNGCKFLTGDGAFEGLPNVEFVK
ncbi:MAG: PIN domain-containing protein [Nanoarchaeota archaeon]